MSVMIHNKGKRKIVFPIAWDEKGMPLIEPGAKMAKEDFIMGGEHKNVSNEVAKHLKSLFPNEIIDINNMSDLQAQFKEGVKVERAPGYITQEESDAKIKAAVADALAGQKKSLPIKTAANVNFIDQLEAMDRNDIMLYIEENNLAVDPSKFKKIDDLKAAVFEAVEAKK